MKTFGKILVLVTLSFAQNSAFANADDPSISGLQRGKICQAINRKYPGTLADKPGSIAAGKIQNRRIVGWVVCRDSAIFFRKPSSSTILILINTHIVAKNYIKCVADLVQIENEPTDIQAKSDSYDVDCPVKITDSEEDID
jgi:hypothetical protein